MSSSQKTVKIISFLLFAVAVLFYVVGGVMLAGAGSLDDSARSTAFTLSMVLFFEGLVYIVYAGLGIRGSAFHRNSHARPERGHISALGHVDATGQ